MKKTATLSRRPMVSLCLALTLVLDCVFFGTFARADDSLNSFQQEIIFAKQKQADISQKIDLIHSVLDQEKSDSLQKEADQLLDELSKKEFISAASVEKPPVELKVQPTKIQKSELKPSQKKSLILKLSPKKVPLIKNKQPAKKWFWPASYGNQYQFTEGQSLYRVAVSDKKVTMMEAIDIGLANNIQLESLKKKVEVAEAKLMEAKRAMFPTIQGSFDVNGGINVGRFYKGESRKINVNQPLFYGGELVFTMKQAEENLKSSKAEYRKASNEFIHQIRIAYGGVIKAEYNAQYQFELYEKVHEIYKRVQEGHRQKVVAEIDFLNVESQYQQVYFQVESSKNDLLSASLILHQILGLENDDLLPVDLQIHFKKIQARFEEFLLVAFQNNPDVQIKENALTSAGLGVKIYKAKKLPRVDLRGSYGMLGEAHQDDIAFAAEKKSNDLEKEWFMGVHVTMPLGPNSVEYDQVKNKFGPTVLALTGSEAWRHRTTFNLFDKLSDITDAKGAEATLLQSQSDYQKAKNDLTVKLKDDFYNLQKSLIQIDSSVAKMRYQDKQNGILEYLLGLQETSVENYLEGLINQSQNKFSFIQAVMDYNMAVSDLSVSIGEPYYFDAEA